MVSLFKRCIEYLNEQLFYKNVYSCEMPSNSFDKNSYEYILGIHENDNELTINRIEKSPACEAGSNYVSLVTRVNVFGVKNNKEYNKRLIAKELPSNQQSQLYRSHIALENEMHAYNVLIPALSAYSSGPLPFPECIYAGLEGIVLQDLCDEGYEAVGARNDGLTIEQCEIVLDGLAKIHAASYVMKHKEPKKFQFITKLVKEILFHGSDSELLTYQAEHIESILQIVKQLSPDNSDHQKAVQLIQDIRDNSRSKIKDLLLHSGPDSVLCHGDCWAANILFNQTYRLKLIDVQQMRCNSVATDVDYLLYTNLLPELHYANRQQLLSRYLHSLRECVRSQGVNMDNVLTKEWLYAELRKYSWYGFIWGMWIMPVFFLKRNSSGEIKLSKDEYEERLKNYILGYIKNIL